MIANPMTARETFDVFYTKKLDVLKTKLNKGSMMGDWSFVPGPEYACRACKGRIFLHTMDGKFYCLLCQKPTYWPAELKTRVDIILQGYPSLDASSEEWQALQSVPTPRQLRGKPPTKAGNEELGNRIRDARKAKGWSKDDLARKIVKRNGQRIAKSSIAGYEDGWTNPPKYILEQIEKILDLKGQENG